MMNRFWTAYAQAVFGDFAGFQDDDGGRPEPGLPPGTPPTRTTALALIDIVSSRDSFQ